MVAAGLAVAAVALFGVNTWLALSNTGAQQVLARRQEFIGQTPQLQRVVQAVAQVLAEAAVPENDGKIGVLLANNGITVRANAPAPVAGRDTAVPGPAVAPLPALSNAVPPSRPPTPPANGRTP